MPTLSIQSSGYCKCDHNDFCKYTVECMKIKHSPPEMAPSQCSHLGIVARPSGAAELHHCLESVRRSISKRSINDTVNLHLIKRLCNYPAYLSEDAVNGLLVHLGVDGVFAQARGHSAEVVQRRHPECHFCLLVAELVHLEGKKWRRNVTMKTNISNTGEALNDDDFEVNDATHQQSAQ